ncbi:Uncharacterised protein [Chromobacterium violaceum]|uniref:Uncharacterized protein n=1 Tax=Chromobacterium violaceum TaxID=536 RepID=A0A447T837_CHRVL|nr:Uncharacterised protein [Chromobacterium violaceum]
MPPSPPPRGRIRPHGRQAGRVSTPPVRPLTGSTTATARKTKSRWLGHGQAADFDLPLLDDLLPACFIATPVLKALPRFELPYGVEWLGGLVGGWDANARRGYFIYGGNWLADPASPSAWRAAACTAIRPTSNCWSVQAARRWRWTTWCSSAAPERGGAAAVRRHRGLRGRPHRSQLAGAAGRGLRLAAADVAPLRAGYRPSTEKRAA